MKTSAVESRHKTSASIEHEVMASIRGLKKSFGDREVLKGVDLDLYKTENLVILGRSGTGKSVLIKCMVGLMKPDSGTINVLGKDVFSLKPKELNNLRLQIGFSFQGSALYDSMTIRENLEFPLIRNLGITKRSELTEMVTLALEDVGLVHTIDQMPSELSGGMRKRAGLARALAMDPELLFLDEPTAGLDPIGAANFDNLTRELKETLGLTVFLITHDLDTLYAICDRVAVLADHKVIAIGPIDDLLATDHPWIKEYFSGPRGRTARRGHSKPKADATKLNVDKQLNAGA